MAPEPVGSWTFEDLTAHRTHPESSLAHRPCALIKPLPGAWRSAKRLANAMSYHYDVEDQASALKTFRTQPDIIPSRLVPFAPVTITDRWSPFPLISRLAGDALDGERRRDGPRRTPPVFAIYRLSSEQHIECEQEASADAAHCCQLLFALLKRTSAKETPILVVARPDWSSVHARNHIVPENVAGLMTRFGYVTTRHAPR